MQLAEIVAKVAPVISDTVQANTIAVKIKNYLDTDRYTDEDINNNVLETVLTAISELYPKTVYVTNAERISNPYYQNDNAVVTVTPPEIMIGNVRYVYSFWYI